MRQLSKTYDALRTVDAIITKASGVREVARAARVETLLRKFVINEWNRLARQASEEAQRVVQGGTGTIKSREVDRVMSAVNRVMRRFPARVRNRFVDEIADVYRMTKIAAHRKATGQTTRPLQFNTRPFSAKVGDDGRTKLTSEDTSLIPVRKQDVELFPSFDVVDRDVVEAMQRDQIFWIGRHYDENVRENVRRVAREEMIESGRSRAAAARRFDQVMRTELAMVGLPSGWRGTSDQYFEALVANAMTTSRAQASIRAFHEVGVIKYEIVNPMDERTCPVCSHMDGKKFFVKQGLDQAEAETNASTPEEVRKVHPWIRATALRQISPIAGQQSDADSKRLADAGFALPPFHFRCRCTLDIDDLTEIVEVGQPIPDDEDRKRREAEARRLEREAQARERERLVTEGKLAGPAATQITRTKDPILSDDRQGLLFGKAPNARNEHIVLADVDKLSTSLARNPEFFVGPGGTGEIAGRIEQVEEFLKQAKDKQTPVHATRATLTGEKGARGAHITDGRHRLAVFRQRGVAVLPVSVHRSEVAEFARRFGAKPRKAMRDVTKEFRKKERQAQREREAEARAAIEERRRRKDSK